MDTGIKCIRCGNTANVFTDAVYNENTHTYTLTPICINCKKADLEVSNVISWEHDLKDIEKSVASQLINEKFGKIKFKNRAREILVDLMQKYSVRCVFEVCMISGSDFNAHLISEKCRERFH